MVEEKRKKIWDSHHTSPGWLTLEFIPLARKINVHLLKFWSFFNSTGTQSLFKLIMEILLHITYYPRALEHILESMSLT